jgi:hypothetical protein
MLDFVVCTGAESFLGICKLFAHQYYFFLLITLALFIFMFLDAKKKLH